MPNTGTDAGGIGLDNDAHLWYICRCHVFYQDIYFFQHKHRIYSYRTCFCIYFCLKVLELYTMYDIFIYRTVIWCFVYYRELHRRRWACIYHQYERPNSARRCLCLSGNLPLLVFRKTPRFQEPAAMVLLETFCVPGS
jgi:hypothetical protein